MQWWFVHSCANFHVLYERLTRIGTTSARIVRSCYVQKTKKCAVLPDFARKCPWIRTLRQIQMMRRGIFRQIGSNKNDRATTFPPTTLMELSVEDDTRLMFRFRQIESINSKKRGRIERQTTLSAERILRMVRCGGRSIHRTPISLQTCATSLVIYTNLKQ